MNVVSSSDKFRYEICWDHSLFSDEHRRLGDEGPAYIRYTQVSQANPTFNQVASFINPTRLDDISMFMLVLKRTGTALLRTDW